MTTDRALVLGDESLYREWGYVSMSRGREENRLYVVMGDGCGRDEVGGAVDRPYAVDELVRSLERSRAKSMAFDPDGDIAEADSASLRAEQHGIYDQLSDGPRDRTRELAQLREERERTKGYLFRERELADKAEKQLASMGTIAKARRKGEVDRLRNRITDAGKVEDRLSEQLQKLAEEEKELVRAQKERERWVTQQTPLVERAEQIENELPKYLESAVGAVPERPSERTEWRQSVLAIEDYREKYGIKDRNRALGGEPRNTEQRHEKEQIERDIEDHNDRRHGRSQDKDHGVERSLELSL